MKKKENNSENDKQVEYSPEEDNENFICLYAPPSYFKRESRRLKFEFLKFIKRKKKK